MKRPPYPRALAAVAIVCTGIIGIAGQQETQKAAEKAAENATLKKQAAAEIERICALRGAEREAALKKFKDESGYELYCAKQ